MAYTTKDFAELKDVLHSAVLSDILDQYDCRSNSMHFSLKALSRGTRMMGRAFTMLGAKVFEIPKEPYKLQLQAIDAISDCEIAVVAPNSDDTAFWGELITTAVLARGGVGAVVDGLSRDTQKIESMAFPLFFKGTLPTDSKGRVDVIAYGVPIRCGGVLVEPGDIVFGDDDGIVIIPKRLEDEVVSGALQKIQQENVVRKALQNGMSATEAFRTYGVL